MAADNVPGPMGGLQQADVGTTEVPFKVTTWVGFYIRIQTGAEQLYFNFSTSASHTLDETTETLDSATPLAAAPDWLEAGTSEHVRVPPLPTPTDEMYLVVKAAANTTAVKVRKAER